MSIKRRAAIQHSFTAKINQSANRAFHTQDGRKPSTNISNIHLIHSIHPTPPPFIPTTTVSVLNHLHPNPPQIHPVIHQQQLKSLGQPSFTQQRLSAVASHNQPTHKNMDKLEYHLSPVTDLSPINAVLAFGNRSPAYKDHRGLARIAISGLCLGVLATASLFGIYFFPSLWRVLLVTFLSCFYHLSEFLMTAYGHHDTVSYDSFLFYQSFEYSFARIVYHLEFFLWYFLFPDLRDSQVANAISILGVVGIIIGQAVRTIAMFQAGESFTHIVATEHKNQHVLIKHGVYKYFRHPSYFGWFLWATSLQLLLFNPIFLVGTIALAYAFFSDRIPYEEAALVRFFGTEYTQYRDSTPTWIPFIR